MAARSTSKSAREIQLAVILLTALALLVAGGIYLGNPDPELFKNNFWHSPAFKQRHSKTRVDAVSLQNGLRGEIRHDGGTNRLSMDVNDVLGDPVPGLEVSARIAAPRGGQRALKPLRPGTDGRYHADDVDLPKGKWNVTLTGRDSARAERSSLRFRVEKQITVK